MQRVFSAFESRRASATAASGRCSSTPRISVEARRLRLCICSLKLVSRPRSSVTLSRTIRVPADRRRSISPLAASESVAFFTVARLTLKILIRSISRGTLSPISPALAIRSRMICSTWW